MNVTIKWDSSVKNSLTINGSMDSLAMKVSSVDARYTTDGSYNGIVVLVDLEAGTPADCKFNLPKPTKSTVYNYVEFQVVIQPAGQPGRKPNPRVIVKDIIPF
jgi:hypothetical protein